MHAAGGARADRRSRDCSLLGAKLSGGKGQARATMAGAFDGPLVQTRAPFADRRDLAGAVDSGKMKPRI
jgi:hypothetical protein